MRIYQSSLSYRTFELIAEYSPDKKVNLLRSFQQDDEQTFKILQDFKENINSAILDSGVWSKFTHPEKYNHTVHDYCKFLQKNKDLFDFYFSYDEDFKETTRSEFYNKNDENQKILEDFGIYPYPVPVLHNLESETVTYYCENRTKYPIVAIGSNATEDPNFRTTVETLYNNNIKVHAFRIGSIKKLIGLKAWSADCSSHAGWTSKGRCIVYNRKKGKETSICFRPLSESGKPQDDYYLNDQDILNDFEWFLENVANITLESVIQDSDYRTYANSMYYWLSEQYITAENAGLVPNFKDEIDESTKEYIDFILK